MTNTPIPLWQRLLTILTQRARTLECDTLQISHRPLARELGCSPAMLPRLMRRLEELGAIARIPFKNGYLVELTGRVIDHPQTSDRSPDRAVIDHPTEVIDHPASESPDRTPLRQTADRHGPRREQHVVLETHESQKQESCTAPQLTADGRALFQRLMQDPRMNARFAQTVAARPIGSVAEFDRQVGYAQAMPGIRDALIFTAARWRDGQPIVASEVPDGSARPATRRPGSGDRGAYRPGAGGGRGARQRRGTAPHSSDRLARYAAYLESLGGDDDDGEAACAG